MKLDSVRSLKQELIARGELSSFPLSAASAKAGSATPSALPNSQPVSPLAIGVSGSDGDYRLAIRVFALTPGIQATLDRISEAAAGEVGIQLVGSVVKQQPWHQQQNRPLRIGGSVGFVPAGYTMAGTLGAFVLSANGDGFMILSNNHVLADENRLPIGSDIVQQGTLDGGQAPVDVVAELHSFVPLYANRLNLVDAAVARLANGALAQPGLLTDLGQLGGVRETPLTDLEPVFKIGRTTGRRKGRISAFELDGVRVRYDMGHLVFNDQIEIEPDPEEGGPFSLGGDSGSLIVDQDLRAVGLLFAGNDFDKTYANPIGPVLSALQVTLA
ncbi:MAG: trypsin-like peptidase domain-containing protein [Thermoanaerobaculia bacterium]